MLILLTTCKLLAAFFFIHLVLWRIRLPKRQFLSLLIIFGTVFILGIVAAAVSSSTFLNVLHIALFYIATCLCYMVLYSAIYQDSPTLSLMRFISENQADGRSAAEVVSFLAQRPFVKGRLAELVDSRLVREENGKYVISGKGSLGFRFILAYRELYGPITKGG